MNKKLVPVQEETEILNITGFVGKPDYFKKARGEQLFFVNKRFIKSNYLHHAVVSAYEDLLPADAYPLYVLVPGYRSGANRHQRAPDQAGDQVRR